MEQPLASDSAPTAPAVSASAKAGSQAQSEVPAAFSLQDHQTLAQLRRGNWAAMEQLVQRYQDRLYATLLRMVGHPEDAADLTQETFVKAMQNIARFEGKSSLYTWLFRIAFNLAISHRRAARYRVAASLDADASEGDSLNHQADGLRRQLAQETEPDPAESAQRRIEHERLIEALNALEPEFRAVIVLRDVQECDYEQIAAILDVPLGTIKSRLFRARLALRKLMGDDPGKEAGNMDNHNAA